MRPRTSATTLVLAAAALALAGCDGGEAVAPDRAPDVVGVVVDDGSGPTLGEPSDEYYEGMSLSSEEAVVLDAAGERIELAQVVDGDAIEVWIEGDFCAESFPVQCRLAALRLR